MKYIANILKKGYRLCTIALIVVVGLCYAACNISEIDELLSASKSIRPEFSLPIGYIHYESQNLFNDLGGESFTLEETREGLYMLRYHWSERVNISSDLVKISDQVFIANTPPQTVDVPAALAPQDIEFPMQTNFYDYDASDGSRVDSLVYRTGTLAISSLSSYDSEATLEVFFPNLQKPVSRESIKKDLLMHPVNGGGYGSGTSQDLVDHLFIFTPRVRSDGTSANTFPTEFLLTIHHQDGKTLRVGSKVDINLVFSNTTFKKVYGRFATQVIDLSEREESIKLQDDVDFNQLTFSNPKMFLRIRNLYGVPFAVSLDGLAVIDEDNIYHSFTGGVIENLHFVDAPTQQQAERGESIETIIELNANNSNLEDLLKLKIKSIRSNITAELNPPAPFPQRTNNLYIDTHYIDVETTLEIPLDMSIEEFEREEKFGNAIDDPATLNEVERLSIRVITQNQMPIEAIADLLFLGPNGEILYTIPDLLVIDAATPDEHGRIESPIENMVEILLDEEAVDMLAHTDSLSAKIFFSSPRKQNGDRVPSRFYNDYTLDFRLALLAELNVEILSSE